MKHLCRFLLAALFCLLLTSALAATPQGEWRTGTGDTLVFGSNQTATLRIAGESYTCTCLESGGTLLLQWRGWYLPVTEGNGTLTLTLDGTSYVFSQQAAATPAPTATATPAPARNGAHMNLRLKVTSASNVSLQWKTQVGATYTIEHRVNGGEWIAQNYVLQGTGKTRSYTIPGFTAGYTYDFRVTEVTNKNEAAVTTSTITIGASTTPAPTAKPTATPKPTATAAPCTRCSGKGQLSGTCSLCNGNGKIKQNCTVCGGDHRVSCSNCGGSGRVKCTTCKATGKIECWYCSGRGTNASGTRTCSHCKGTGKDTCDVCDGAGTKKDTQCQGSNGSGIQYCRYCSSDGKVQVTCTGCSGRGTYTGTCPDCKGTGKRTTTTTTTTTSSSTTKAPSAGTAGSVRYSRTVSISGKAWNSGGVSDPEALLSNLSSGYALRITYAAADNGYVWICLPHSKAEWTGIGQSNPIRQNGCVIIPYSVISKAAGSSKSSWGTGLYIKGNTDWYVTKIEVVRWTE